jgi:hypothetical protein
MSLGTSNRDGGKTSESGHLRALYKALGSGVISGLNVSQRGAGANMSVDVAIGDAIIGRSDLTYGHPSFNDAVYNQAISAADVSNPRRDIIVKYVDYGQTPSTGVSNNTNGVVKIKVVNGTPAGSPADPSDVAIQASVGSGNPWIKLARVRVAAGASSITNSVIDDLRTIIAPTNVIRVQKFTASGTYTPHANMVHCIIEVVGGGGGGGNAKLSTNFNLYAAGGGSGGYAKKFSGKVEIGASQAVTIGAGGAGNASTASTMPNTVLGGDTSVGTLCKAKGGGNGGYVEASVQVSGVGLGGSNTGAIGDILIPGQAGQTGLYSGVVGQDIQFLGGNGGTSQLGAAAGGQVNAAGDNAPANSGGGGAGAGSYKNTSAKAGGNGGSGYVIITEFCNG